MGKGRRPLAQEIHHAQGTFRQNPQRENKQAPKPILGYPQPPESVQSMPKAAAKWVHLCGILEELNMLATCDVDLIEAYCITYAMYRDALANVTRTGQVLMNKNAKGVVEVRRSPFSVELHKYMDRLTKILPEFGLTPASRSRVHTVDQKDEEDPFDELLARMNRG